MAVVIEQIEGDYSGLRVRSKVHSAKHPARRNYKQQLDNYEVGSKVLREEVK